MNRGWSPGGAGSTFEAELMSDWPMGLKFLHRAGRYQPGGTRFSSRGC